MTYITCERLIFLTPSIEKILVSSSVQQLCASRISQTRSYLRCCYISLKNFLIEFLEITDIKQAEKLVLFDKNLDLTRTQCVAVGLQTNNLHGVLDKLAAQGIGCSEMLTSKDPNYQKGYRHSSACLDARWFDKKVYVSEYDDQFFNFRRGNIVTDTQKMLQFSVVHPELDLEDFCPPKFIIFRDGKPELAVQSATKEFTTLECGWLTFKALPNKAQSHPD